MGKGTSGYANTHLESVSSLLAIRTELEARKVLVKADLLGVRAVMLHHS
jgi:hypothetical protein